VAVSSPFPFLAGIRIYSLQQKHTFTNLTTRRHLKHLKWETGLRRTSFSVSW